ncbi:MAG: pyridoxal phosphate-dependent aminotransferase [Verrucomicrobia bacterium]|nr:pyridoxal phosphate-dependent aminotransferase [Verrucomicrobiota bacterium]MDA1086127.1 pyridoxal phosphate-dependent aminotransferase [Verrucomicrobiota bacterium]
MPESRRIAAVQDPMIPIVGDLIAKHPGTISLGQGIVHYPPPPEVFEALRALEKDPDAHAYQSVRGIQILTDEIERKLKSDNHIRVQHGRNRIIVTAGGNMAFNNALLAIADPGDEVILLSPYYFNHQMAIEMASCRAVAVATDDHHQPDIERIRLAITPRTRAVVTVSPNNPTGAVYTRSALREINNLCRDAGVYHISDEAYEYFTYGDAKHYSPASDDEAANHTISLFSLSKSYGFASWRIGYMLVPGHLERAVCKIQDTILICPPVVSQHAATAAMKVGAEYPRRFLEEMSRVRTDVIDRLAGIEQLVLVPPADGAFYVFLHVNSQYDDMEIVGRLIQDYKIAAMPGSTFGMPSGQCLRIAYGALDRSTVDEGVDRLVTGLRAIIE